MIKCKKKLLFLVFIIVIFIQNSTKCHDVTILGLAKFNDGLGRIAVTLMNLFKDDLKINFLKTRDASYEEIHPEILKIINSSNYSFYSKVIILTDSLNHVIKFKNLLKKNNIIKIAYSMFETTRIAESWVKDLNNYFDAVVVPDEFFIKVYVDSGVKIPIFVLPIGLYLDDFLNTKPKEKVNKPFVFGCMSSFDKRKNMETIIKSFFIEFGNSKEVLLKINGRAYFNKELEILLKNLNSTNIQITNKELTWQDYINFMYSFDCYVALAKGEGFSIPPREAMALGIPCIITNNTAQKTLCNTGFVRPIASNILEKPVAYEKLFGSKNLGHFFNCTLKDTRQALRDMYNNYNYYFSKAPQAREWVKQYRWQNLKAKYLNLIKPKKVILGKKNIITESCIITSSSKLYNKYTRLIKSNL